MKIMKERCDQCLYGPSKIVSNARRAKILREIAEKDSHFICHKAQIAGEEVSCAGDWQQRGCGQMGRIAERLGVLRFVTLDEIKADA